MRLTSKNNAQDPGTLFIFGKADCGEKVDEKTAMQIATVYACSVIRLQRACRLQPYSDDEECTEIQC